MFNPQLKKIAQTIIQHTQFHLPITILLISHKIQYSNVNYSTSNKKKKGLKSTGKERSQHTVSSDGNVAKPAVENNCLDICVK